MTSDELLIGVQTSYEVWVQHKPDGARRYTKTKNFEAACVAKEEAQQNGGDVAMVIECTRRELVKD